MQSYLVLSIKPIFYSISKQTDTKWIKPIYKFKKKTIFYYKKLKVATIIYVFNSPTQLIIKKLDIKKKYNTFWTKKVFINTTFNLNDNKIMT